MKLLPALAVIGVLVLSPTAFAQTTPTNKADCEKAKMKWVESGADKKGACGRSARKDGREEINTGACLPGTTLLGPDVRIGAIYIPPLHCS